MVGVLIGMEGWPVDETGRFAATKRPTLQAASTDSDWWAGTMEIFDGRDFGTVKRLKISHMVWWKRIGFITWRTQVRIS